MAPGICSLACAGGLRVIGRRVVETGVAAARLWRAGDRVPFV
jgi:hypothetical protein